MPENLALATNTHDRQIIVITGKESECLRCAKQLIIQLDYLWLEEPKKAQMHLGQEYDAVIINFHQGFDANAFGAITGTIRGGGYLLLLRSDKYPDNKSLFLKRFWSITFESMQYINTSIATLAPLSSPPPKTYFNIFANEDQRQTVKAIEHVVTGHRRRPLVITADRGRGKSAALGIAAAKLFTNGYTNVVICAPSKKMAAVIFEHALNSNPKCRLKFLSPDELQQQKPVADLVLVDEAAAIPIALLIEFVRHYSRIVFSSTQHGYEGSGRGFAINFKKQLDKLAPDWKNCQLKTPIRWNNDDSLEAFVFKVLLLNIEPAKLNKAALIHHSQCQIVILDRTQLLHNESLLVELFGLLVSAHYQTKPSDLMMLLDDEAVSIHVVQHQQNIIAVALLVKEGDITPATAKHIYEGTRRMQGHLVAQSLAASAGVEYAPCLLGERIVRIAVHPDLQQQGFGSLLLSSLQEQSKADYLSTSFGATKGLIKFWEKQNFITVHLGIKRDASSGAHSLIMLYGINEHGQKLVNDSQQLFSQSFFHGLVESFKTLEINIVIPLLASIKVDTTPLPKTEENALLAFSKEKRRYENSTHAIWTVTRQRLGNVKNIEVNEQKILILKVLQKHPWQAVTTHMKGVVSGKKEALDLLRLAISKLL